MLTRSFPLAGTASILFAVVSFLWASEILAAAAPKEKAGGDTTCYAVVAEKKTVEEGPWKAVVEALRKKHSAKILHWDTDEAETLRKELAALAPRYVCFVARPDELARKAKVKLQLRDGRSLELPLHGTYYHKVGTLMRSLDDDPYDDAVWTVLTGATPADALRVVSAKPLVVRRGLSHVGSGWLDKLESGVSFSECKKNQKWVKQPGKPPEETEGPDDTTKQFVEELNGNRVDMVSSSGHATEQDWQMGYSYRNGQLATPRRLARLPQAAKDNYKKLLDADAPEDGPAATRLFGVDTSNEVHGIRTTNPKIYYSPGNCRIANVDAEDCMVLVWIHHGAMQFFGHVGLQTRSCYAWGIAEYFLSLQGRFTFAESVWLNQQALRWEVGRLDEKDRKRKYVCCRNEQCMPAGRAFFWQTIVLYGDPAWEARVKPVVEPLYDQQVQTKKLKDGRVELTFTVKMRRSQLPSRPAAFLLNTPAGSRVDVKKGPERLVVADNFALVPFWKAGETAPEIGKQYQAVVVVGKHESDK